MAAHQYQLDNLCAVVDRNRLQISGNTEDVMGHDDLHERFRSFGWHVIDVKDGNDIDELHAAFEEAKRSEGETNGTDRQYGERKRLLLLWKIKQTGIIKFRHRKSMISL
mgnify:CR=1 FL=1